MLPGKPNSQPPQRHAGWWRLALASALVGLAWLVVLPWIAHRPAVQAHIDRLQREHIDPSAMYYTELEVMQPILERLLARDRGWPVVDERVAQQAP